ncbi:MAG: phage capsid protein, partial [Kineosporiaceae bacterium]
TIIRTAGYSPGTLGETRNAGGAAVTATEIAARERRSYLTRSRKLRHETPAVAGLLAKMLSVATGAAVPADAVDVHYADAVEEQPEVVARTLQMLDAASAVTTETKVRMLHPDWDDPRIAQEVAGLMSERPATVVDPLAV